MTHHEGRARRIVSLAGRRVFFADGVEQWLVALRWVAIAGMVSTSLLAKAVMSGVRLAPILALVGVAALGNVAWMFALRARTRFVAQQIVGDVVTLGAILWFAGGLTNPFAVFLVFQIALSGVLSKGSTTALVTLVTLATVLVLFFAAPLPWETARYDVGMLRRCAYVASIGGLSAFSGFSVFVYGERLEALRIARARDERLALLGRLAGGVAHELNTPLATILLASRELEDEIASRVVSDGPLPEQDQALAQLSQLLASEAKRASDVIDLLRGRVHETLSRESIDLATFVREQATRELDRLGFRGERTIDVPRTAVAFASRAALRQIVANVLKNAVEATQGVTRSRIEVTVESHEGRVSVRVRDNGPGIRGEDLARVGEPFQTTKEMTGGSGLGLYICAMLAEQMQSELQIESREGEETCVTLTLGGVGPVTAPPSTRVPDGGEGGHNGAREEA